MHILGYMLYVFNVKQIAFTCNKMGKQKCP